MKTARPANPANISFDRRCFAQNGTTVTWIVGGNLAPNYPATFANEADAVAYARRTGRSAYVRREESPRMVRISWT